MALPANRPSDKPENAKPKDEPVVVTAGAAAANDNDSYGHFPYSYFDLNSELHNLDLGNLLKDDVVLQDFVRFTVDESKRIVFKHAVNQVQLDSLSKKNAFSDDVNRSNGSFYAIVDGELISSSQNFTSGNAINNELIKISQKLTKQEINGFANSYVQTFRIFPSHVFWRVQKALIDKGFSSPNLSNTVSHLYLVKDNGKVFLRVINTDFVFETKMASPRDGESAVCHKFTGCAFTEYELLPNGNLRLNKVFVSNPLLAKLLVLDQQEKDKKIENIISQDADPNDLVNAVVKIRDNFKIFADANTDKDFDQKAVKAMDLLGELMDPLRIEDAVRDLASNFTSGKYDSILLLKKINLWEIVESRFFAVLNSLPLDKTSKDDLENISRMKKGDFGIQSFDLTKTSGKKIDAVKEITEKLPHNTLASELFRNYHEASFDYFVNEEGNKQSLDEIFKGIEYKYDANKEPFLLGTKQTEGFDISTYCSQDNEGTIFSTSVFNAVDNKLAASLQMLPSILTSTVAKFLLGESNAENPDLESLLCSYTFQDESWNEVFTVLQTDKNNHKKIFWKNSDGSVSLLYAKFYDSPQCSLPGSAGFEKLPFTFSSRLQLKFSEEAGKCKVSLVEHKIDLQSKDPGIRELLRKCNFSTLTRDWDFSETLAVFINLHAVILKNNNKSAYFLSKSKIFEKLPADLQLQITNSAEAWIKDEFQAAVNLFKRTYNEISQLIPEILKIEDIDYYRFYEIEDQKLSINRKFDLLTKKRAAIDAMILEYPNILEAFAQDNNLSIAFSRLQFQDKTQLEEEKKSFAVAYNGIFTTKFANLKARSKLDIMEDSFLLRQLNAQYSYDGSLSIIPRSILDRITDSYHRPGLDEKSLEILLRVSSGETNENKSPQDINTLYKKGLYSPLIYALPYLAKTRVNNNKPAVIEYAKQINKWWRRPKIDGAIALAIILAANTDDKTIDPDDKKALEKARDRILTYKKSYRIGRNYWQELSSDAAAVVLGLNDPAVNAFLDVSSPLYNEGFAKKIVQDLKSLSEKKNDETAKTFAKKIREVVYDCEKAQRANDILGKFINELNNCLKADNFSPDAAITALNNFVNSCDKLLKLPKFFDCYGEQKAELEIIKQFAVDLVLNINFKKNSGSFGENSYEFVKSGIQNSIVLKTEQWFRSFQLSTESTGVSNTQIHAAFVDGAEPNGSEERGKSPNPEALAVETKKLGKSVSAADNRAAAAAAAASSKLNKVEESLGAAAPPADEVTP